MFIQASKANENQSGAQSDPNTGDASLLGKDSEDGSISFSKKQIKGLRDQWSAYTRLMMDANILDAQIFNQQNAVGAGLIGAMAMGPLKEYTPPTLKEMIDRSTWHNRLSSCMDMFREMFVELTLWGREDDENRQKRLDALFSDYTDILKTLAKDSETIQASGQGLTEISAAAREVLSNGVQLTFNSTISAAASPSSPNRHPVEGVLFRVDEASEASPAVGPGLPLYIPSEVAAAALKDVSGLPFDAHDNLSEHANAEVTGVIQSGRLDGKDGIVSGCLWPWNRKEKVNTILAAKEKLGMSMNAAAAGHEATVDGRKVYWIDRLVLLGANILYSDRATYQKTRFISAEAGSDDSLSGHQPVAAQASVTTEDTPEPEPETPPALTLSLEPEADEADELADEESIDELVVPDELEIEEPELPAGEVDDAPLAASAQDQTPSEDSIGDPTMSIEAEQFKEQLNQISASIGQLTGLAAAVESNGTAIAEIRAELGVIKAARASEEAAIQAAADTKKKEEEQKALIQQIQAGVAEAMAKMVNPSGQPARRTVPISANATAVAAPTTETTQLHMVLASKQGELKAMESNLHTNPSDMISVQEEIHTLKMQLGML